MAHTEQTLRDKLNMVAAYDFGVYRIPNGYAIADPMDGDDGWYPTGNQVEPLLDETIDTWELCNVG
jgi:hypothetical protein